jgi:hypothetical protein
MRGTHRWVVVVVASTLALGGCGIDSLAGVGPAPAENTAAAPITGELAGQVTKRVLENAGVAERAPAGAEGDTARAAALSGTALDLAKASATLSPPSGSTDALSRPDEPRVLAISAGHTYPRAILATSADSDSRQHLAVLTTNEITTPYLLENTVTMLPGATLPAVGDLAKGATLVAPEDGTNLVLTPKAAIEGYAAALNLPNPAANDVIDAGDAYATALRQAQGAQVAGLGTLASLGQTHTAVPESLRTIRLADGSALVLGRINRVDTITAGDNTQELKVPDALQKVVGAATAPKVITVNAIESVALIVPATGQGKVKLIGIVEQLTGGSAQ